MCFNIVCAWKIFSSVKVQQNSRTSHEKLKTYTHKNINVKKMRIYLGDVKANLSFDYSLHDRQQILEIVL